MRKRQVLLFAGVAQEDVRAGKLVGHALRSGVASDCALFRDEHKHCAARCEVQRGYQRCSEQCWLYLSRNVARA